MKKWGYLCASLVTALSVVAGCGAPSAPTPAKPAEPNQQAAAAPAASEGAKEITVAANGGKIEKTIRDVIAPKFKEKYGIQVNYIAGLSGEILSKVELQKDAPQIDISMFVPADVERASAKGLTETMDKSVFPNAAKVNAVYSANDNAIPVFGYAIAPAYNTEAFKKNNWPEITSWNDLARDEFKGRIAVTDITNEWGFTTLTYLAVANGGGLDNMQSGLEKAKQLARNSQTFYKNSTQLNPALQQGAADVTVMGSYILAGLIDAGLPYKLVVPKEGIPLQAVSAAIVKNAPHKKEAQDFLNFLISEEIQKDIADASFYPVLDGMKVSPKYEATIGFEDTDKVDKPDVSKITSIRTEWTEKWTKEVTPELGKNLK